MKGTLVRQICLIIFLACGGLTVAGPPGADVSQRPLTGGPTTLAVANANAAVADAAAPPAAEAEAEQQLYYYNGTEKVYLNDTGTAIAKLAAGVDPSESPLSRHLFSPAFNDPLVELAPALRRGGFVLVRTGGPEDMNLFTVSNDPPEGVEYVLPVVEVDRQQLPTPRPEGASRSVMVMTPYISARFTNDFFGENADRQAKQEKVEAFVEPFGLEVSEALRIPNAYRLELSEGPAAYPRILEAANKLYAQGAEDQALLYAKPDFLRTKKRHQITVDDPRFANQWHLNNTGQGGGVADADVDAREAWEVSEGDPQIRVAVIDDSVEKDHEDLEDNYVTGRRYLGFQNPPSFDDDPSPLFADNRHGTPCAGVAVGAANESGIRGAAPRCGLIGVHFWYSTDTQIAEAFYFCNDPNDDGNADDGAAVISCSWSLNIDPPADLTIALDDLAETGRNGRGTVILFASGNDNGPILPDNQNLARESVIVVGATSNSDVRSWYSNSGPELSVVAPSSHDSLALRIDTTDNTDPDSGGSSGYAVGSYTGTGSSGFGGTSSATPLTAGVSALILSVNPELEAWQVRSILEHTADRIRGGGPHPSNYDLTTSHDPNYGYGRINAKKAVHVARASQTDPQAVWPDHVQNLSASRSDSVVNLTWQNPPGDVQGVLVIRSLQPTGSTGWRPIDGERYQIGDVVGNGRYVVVSTDTGESLDVAVGPDNPSFAVFPFNADFRYGWGEKTTAAASTGPVAILKSAPDFQVVTSPGAVLRTVGP